MVLVLLLPCFMEKVSLMTDISVCLDAVCAEHRSSFIAGFFGAVASNPIDVVKVSNNVN